MRSQLEAYKFVLSIKAFYDKMIFKNSKNII